MVWNFFGLFLEVNSLTLSNMSFIRIILTTISDFCKYFRVPITG